MPKGMPLSSMKRSREMAVRGTGCFLGVLMQQAQIRPAIQQPRAVTKMMSNDTWSCMNRPVIGPRDMAMLLASP